MGLPRIVIGGVLSAVGIFSWLKILDENTPKPNEPVSDVWNPDVFLTLIIVSVICGIGIWLLVSGIRSSNSSN